jgi:hypothetical protein
MAKNARPNSPSPTGPRSANELADALPGPPSAFAASLVHPKRAADGPAIDNDAHQRVHALDAPRSRSDQHTSGMRRAQMTASTPVPAALRGRSSATRNSQLSGSSASTASSTET